MSFETTDWYTEARRIKAAFGVLGKCRFVRTPDRKTYYLITRSHLIGGHEIFTSEEFELRVDYGRATRVFGLARPPAYTEISVGWDGAITGSIFWDGAAPDSTGSREMALPLAKALFHLGLLSDEAETALGVCVSAHQKAEWLLEYEARNGR